MRMVLTIGLAAMLMVPFAEEGRAQGEDQPEQTEDEFGPREGRGFSVESVRGGQDRGQIQRIVVHPLFTVELRTDISLEGRCYYYLEEPCSVFFTEVVNYARNELLLAGTNLLKSMLHDRRFKDTLRQSTAYEMRKELLELRRENQDNPGTLSTTGRVLESTEPRCPCPARFPPPNTGHLAIGTFLFAGGGILSATKNEWPVDEGIVGVGVAAFGLGMVLKQLVPEWRSAKVSWFGANASVTW